VSGAVGAYERRLEKIGPAESEQERIQKVFSINEVTGVIGER
jgi:hypothetical protein